MTETVYVRTAQDGDAVSCYHTSRECRYAQQCNQIHEITRDQAERRGLDVCPGVRCGDTQAPNTGPDDPHATKRMLLDADPDTPFPVEGDG